MDFDTYASQGVDLVSSQPCRASRRSAGEPGRTAGLPGHPRLDGAAGPRRGPGAAGRAAPGVARGVRCHRRGPPAPTWSRSSTHCSRGTRSPSASPARRRRLAPARRLDREPRRRRVRRRGGDGADHGLPRPGRRPLRHVHGHRLHRRVPRHDATARAASARSGAPPGRTWPPRGHAAGRRADRRPDPSPGAAAPT